MATPTDCKGCETTHDPLKPCPPKSAALVKPRAPTPKLSGGQAKVVAGLREAVEVAAGRAEPARVTVLSVVRDKDKHAAAMRAWRAKKKAEA